MPARRSRRFGTILVLSALLVVLVLSAFSNVTDYEFINFDDDKIVTKNPHVQSGLTPDEVRWAFSTLYYGHWMPLTWLSHMLDVKIWNLDPRGHHLTNLLLHLVNAILLFLVVRSYTGALIPSFFTAALFAIHPLRAEPVAWISARRDLLSTTLLILTIGAYRRYVSLVSPGRYVIVMGTFLLGLMAKPMLVTLPACLLLLDLWPLDRLRYPWLHTTGPASSNSTVPVRMVILEKVPFFFISAAWILVTFIAEERLGAVGGFVIYPVWDRISNAVISYLSYLTKTLWPANLAILYPFPAQAPPLWKVLSAAVLLVGITLLALLCRRKRPYLLMGWLWHVLTLVPVIGLVQIGTQAMADRYTYVPHIGIFIAAISGLAALPISRRYRTLLLSIVAAVVLPVCLVLTRNQVAFWRDSMSIFGHTIEVTHGNFLAHYNFGAALSSKGRESEAIPYYMEAIRINPRYVTPHYNLGLAYLQLGKLQDAASQLRIAIQMNPQNADAYVTLGVVAARSGKLDEAVGYFLETLRIRPDHEAARNNLKQVYILAGRLEEARNLAVSPPRSR